MNAVPSIKAYLIVNIRVKSIKLIQKPLIRHQITIDLYRKYAMPNEQIPTGVKRDFTKVHASDLISRFSSKRDLFLYLHEQVSQPSIQPLIPLL